MPDPAASIHAGSYAVPPWRATSSLTVEGDPLGIAALTSRVNSCATVNEYRSHGLAQPLQTRLLRLFSRLQPFAFRRWKFAADVAQPVAEADHLGQFEMMWRGDEIVSVVLTNALR